MELKQRVAVITGATGGAGRAAAAQLAQAGVRLALFSSNQDNLQALVDELGLAPEQTLIQALDLRQPEAGAQAAQATLERFGRADILLHFVGGWTGGKPLVDVEPGALEHMLGQHVWTTFYLAQAFTPHFVQQGWGRIVVISSPTAGAPPAKSAPYAAAKAAQETLLLTLAQEIKGSGVTSNVIRVSTIDVEHQREKAPNAKNAGWTTPEEIAAAILYLCSDAAGMLNGARLPLYGSP